MNRRLFFKSLALVSTALIAKDIKFKDDNKLVDSVDNSETSKWITHTPKEPIKVGRYTLVGSDTGEFNGEETAIQELGKRFSEKMDEEIFKAMSAE